MNQARIKVESYKLYWRVREQNGGEAMLLSAEPRGSHPGVDTSGPSGARSASEQLSRRLLRRRCRTA